MSNLADVLLRRYNASVRGRNPQLNEESIDLEANRTLEIPPSPDDIEHAIAKKRSSYAVSGRCSLIKHDETDPVFADAADREIWRARLQRAKPLLARAVPAGAHRTHGQQVRLGPNRLAALR